MTDDRVACGRRSLGHRRLCAFLVATLALILVGAPAPFADGAPAIGGFTLPLTLSGVSAANAQSGGAAAGPGSRSGKAPKRRASVASGALADRSMWIWELGSSEGGSISSIITKAHRYGIGTLMIKSGDGSSTWSQFTSRLVSRLHAGGLRVCAWQYVYGNFPTAEAHVGAAAVKDGADCLIIDAETEYEGRYVEAQQYVTGLRRLIGPRFPVALAGFPYVDYHPAFPYSVFLGPGGAQYSAPQMYWQAIGTSVDAVYSHTYRFNRLYQRSIYPLGQVYNSPPPKEIVRFRQLSLAYGARGLSWWDWQEASSAGWRALAQTVGTLAGFKPSAGLASLGRGAKGDLVVWAQEHLATAGQRVTVDGGFGPKTQRAVSLFQAAHGLAVTGLINAATWPLLLAYAPAYVHWGLHATRDLGRTAAAAAVPALTPVPKSASLRPVRNEIAGAGGAGRPGRH